MLKLLFKNINQLIHTFKNRREKIIKYNVKLNKKIVRIQLYNIYINFYYR